MLDTWVATLADTLKRAHAAAVEAGNADTEDGGTCNMDTPAFRIDRVREVTIMRAAELAGVEVSPFKWMGGRRWFWLRVPNFGQANRRSRAMEAAQRVLRDAEPLIPGMTACGWYQMD